MKNKNSNKFAYNSYKTNYEIEKLDKEISYTILSKNYKPTIYQPILSIKTKICKKCRELFEYRSGRGKSSINYCIPCKNGEFIKTTLRNKKNNFIKNKYFEQCKLSEARAKNNLNK